MEKFAKFIELMEVVDLPIGNKFTWINSNGKTRSRIDRILLSKGILYQWKVVAQVTGNRDISDHRRVWLKSSILDRGPKPFKVFNSWFEHEDFLKFVRQQGESFKVQGSSAFILKEKLRRLRDSLRGWNNRVFKRLDLHLEEEVKLLNELKSDGMSINSQLSQEVNARRKKSQDNIWRLLQHKEIMIKQKARLKWIKEGDNNTKYFHSVLKTRTRKNTIVSIQSDQGRLEGVEEVKEGVKKFFEQRFKKQCTPRPRLQGLEFNKLNDVERLALKEKFSREEIREVVFGCEGDRSPGPDGYNL
ncbi:uncharacterized protein LOC131625459 [Vicia villosa]|uniref:uncharacterized protein LOC131625459 n=1 Tax=Vicia villosa TaxID=3911 RepID=UPI00273C124D|nr:uncharacterized protein LOC131625459 [Vicia villosa]